MALYIHTLNEWPDPNTRAAYVGVHKPLDGEAQRPTQRFAELSASGFMTTCQPLSPDFAIEIAQAFAALVK